MIDQKPSHHISLTLSKERYGWPWTTKSKPLPNLTKNGHPWPRISIVTPSYNQGQFLEETLRSVLLQGYPNLEYIIMDGGSSDNSAEIIEKYAPQLAYWESKPDSGQTHAINKGLKRSTGTIMGWLNSDDILLPKSLCRIAETFSAQPSTMIATGFRKVYDAQSRFLYNGIFDLPTAYNLHHYNCIPQEDTY